MGIVSLLVRGRRGQALVEFALILPVFLLLILGMVDLGRAYFYKNDLTHLANEAVRFATVGSCAACGSDPIETYVKNNAGSGELRDGGGQIESPGATVSLCFPDGTSAVGDAIRADVTARYDWLPFFGNLVGIGPATISSSATMRLEQAYVDPATSHYTGGPCA